jgi:hypothetical protein
MPNLKEENRTLRKAARAAEISLRSARQHLAGALVDEGMRSQTPREVSSAMESAVTDLDAALRTLDPGSVFPVPNPVATTPGGPTRQQGQFLAYIREYMLRNHAGVAPTHAALQRFFNLTPPSVNSMLKRLESRGFIRRIPRQARAIELTIDPSLIPPLEWPFKL